MCWVNQHWRSRGSQGAREPPLILNSVLMVSLPSVILYKHLLNSHRLVVVNPPFDFSRSAIDQHRLWEQDNNVNVLLRYRTPQTITANCYTVCIMDWNTGSQHNYFDESFSTHLKLVNNSCNKLSHNFSTMSIL